ncbi:hypothetical protein E2C01_081162 [Portunus trituberculatus]|uniref:Uncharacterized protein n=1 Tax=Portunus trituberculatus TaxID=210409 RepID=A0A5B7IVW5_PORTR|nr:hypothetical protein [Portunus trituberculatus]
MGKFSYKISISVNYKRRRRSFVPSFQRCTAEDPGEHLAGPHLTLLPPLECRRGLSEPLDCSFSPPLLPLLTPSLPREL